MYYNSIIFGFIFDLLNKLKDLYYASTTARLIKKLADRGKALFSHSVIWNFVKRKDYLSSVWEYSGVARFLTWVLNAPAAFLGRFYHGSKDAVKESYTVRIITNSAVFRFVRLLLVRFEVTIGLSIALIAVIHHRIWNNLFSTVIILGLFVIYFIKTLLQRYEGFNVKAIDFALFAFMLSVVMAELTGLFPKDSLRSFIFYATCFLFVLLISSSMRTGRALNGLVEIMLVGICLTGIYAIYQSIMGVPTDPSLTDLTLNAGMPGRVYSTMQNPNSYAEVLILTLPFFAAVIFNAESILRKLFFTALAIPPLFALFATGSRSSWIGLAAAIMVLVFFKERRLIPVAVLLGILSLPVMGIVAPSIYRRVMTIFKAGKDTSFNYRGYIFETFKPMLQDFWFTGIGLGSGMKNQTFMKILQRYPLHFELNRTYPPHTHNTFLQIWIEVGFVGIVTFVWFIIRMVKNCMINIFSGAEKQVNHILMAGVAAISANLVMSLAEYTWFYPRAMLFFWIDIGIILAGLAIVARKKDGLSKKSVK